jgi:hypothetical protein
MDFNEYRKRLRERLVPAAFVEEAVCVAEEMLEGKPAPEPDPDPTRVEMTIPIPDSAPAEETPAEPDKEADGSGD